MAITTRTLLGSGQKILKEVYSSDNIYRTFNRKRILPNLLRRKPQEVYEGNQFRYNVHTAGSSAGTHAAENATLPAADQQANDWLIFNMATYLHPIQLTGEVMHSTGSKEAAMIKALDFAAREAVKDAMDDFSIAMYTPHTGLLTRVLESPTSTTVFKVENPRRLRVGQTVAVAKISDHAVANGKASTVITDISGKTVTVATALTATTWTTVDNNSGATDHGVYPVQNFTASAARTVNPFGLEDIVLATDPAGPSSNEYGQIDRDDAGTDWAKGRALDLNGGNIDHDVADEAADLVEVAGNGEVSCWITTPEIFREINKLHVGDKRATMREKVGDGWFMRSLLAGRPVYKDKYCTPGTIYGLDLDNIWIAENKPVDWEEEDGAILHRLETKWGYQALLTRMWQIVAIPNCHVRISEVASQSYSA